MAQPEGMKEIGKAIGEEIMPQNENWWKNITEPVLLKTILTLFALETEIVNSVKPLDDREKDILRWAVFFLHMGSAKRKCKTSK